MANSLSRKISSRKTEFFLALVTCASRRQAHTIARSVVAKRLAACVNVFESPVASVYRWKNKVERVREVLLVIKTSHARLAALQSEIERLHSYDVPEFIVLPVVAGSAAYLKWLGDSTADLRE